MQPLIKLADGTLLATSAIGAVTTNVAIDSETGVDQWQSTTRVLSRTGAVLYEAAALLPMSDKTGISIAVELQKAIVATIEKAFQ